MVTKVLIAIGLIISIISFVMSIIAVNYTEKMIDIMRSFEDER